MGVCVVCGRETTEFRKMIVKTYICSENCLQRYKTFFIVRNITFGSGIALLLGFFFPSNPSGTVIYLIYFILGYLLTTLLGLPGIGYISFYFQKLHNWFRRKVKT